MKPKTKQGSSRLAQEGKEYELTRLALGRIMSSPYKTGIIESLSDGSLDATELFEKSAASSEGTFYYHLRDLEWLGVVEHPDQYRLTEFGKKIIKSLNKLK